MLHVSDILDVAQRHKMELCPFTSLLDHPFGTANVSLWKTFVAQTAVIRSDQVLPDVLDLVRPAWVGGLSNHPDQRQWWVISFEAWLDVGAEDFVVVMTAENESNAASGRVDFGALGRVGARYRVVAVVRWFGFEEREGDGYTGDGGGEGGSRSRGGSVSVGSSYGQNECMEDFGHVLASGGWADVDVLQVGDGEARDSETENAELCGTDGLVVLVADADDAVGGEAGACAGGLCGEAGCDQVGTFALGAAWEAGFVEGFVERGEGCGGDEFDQADVGEGRGLESSECCAGVGVDVDWHRGG